MTSRATQIQSMIADIDKLLTHKGKRLWGGIASQEEPRQVLQRIRDFLASETDGETEREQAQLPPLVAKFVGEGTASTSVNASNSQSVDSQLSDLIQPLKVELKTLAEERANLVSEIRELEKKRLHDYSLAQQLASQEKIISEFMQVLKTRLSGDISGISASGQGINSANTNIVSAAGDRVDSVNVERLTQLTNDLDRRLVALDGTVNVVFEGLQRNIHAYHDSLSQSLARMHYKGVQGEQLLEGFIQNVARLPQQQVSPVLQQTIDAKSVESVAVEEYQKVNNNASVELTEAQVNNQDNNASVELAEAQVNNQDNNASVELVEAQVNNQDNDASVELAEAQVNNQDNNASVELVETSQIDNQDNNASVELAETSQIDNQDNNASVEPVETYNPEKNEKLEVTPDETIDNIEFSQAQEDSDDTSITSDLQSFITQLESDDTQSNEVELSEEKDAFDSPEKMQAVLSELKKSATQTEDFPAQLSESSKLPAQTTSNANEDEVDELYASLFDTDVTPSNLQTPPQEIRQTAIDVETPDTSDFEEIQEIPETQIEKEVVSQEVVFEYVDEPSTIETSESSPDATVSDPWFNSNNTDLANSSELTNQTTAKTSYRKTQAATEDTITSLTELLFEEASTEVVAPLNSESQQQEVASLEKETQAALQQQEINPITEETATPPQQPEVNLITEETAVPPQQPEINLITQETQAPPQQPEVNPITEETAAPPQQQNLSELFVKPTQQKPQLQEITLPVTSLRQPDKNSDASTLDPLPQTEKTTAPDEENLSSDNSTTVNAPEIPFSSGDTVWYLGLDLGTTGISAALLNRSTQVIHPVYWAQENQAQTASQTLNFRLPAEVYLPKTSIGDSQAQENIYSTYLKPYLQISLPYKETSETNRNEVRQRWEPILQLNEFSTVPLVWIIRSLSKLLLTLKSDSNSTTLGLTATAIGIEKEDFSSIINNIAGVICTCPSNWSEQYRFNIRESLLISQLIKHPQQVFFVEEAVATLLGELEGANGEIVKLVNSDSAPVVVSDRQLNGNTLVINIGATATEMALVDLPENLQDLSHNEFMLHGFTCGGKAMEQDIITQLLLPEKWRQSRNTQSNDSGNNKELHWKPNIPGLDKVRFSSLGLEQLELPRAGEPDISQRIRLQQRLESSPLGKALLDAAIALKLILQHQESFTIELADQTWELQRRDLESQVFVPFVRRINRELNKLLVTRGIPTEAINQIILSGGVSSINAINRWLRQKLPTAKIIQEKYLGENGTPACSRVAMGLCVLPLHPLVLEIPRQQYTDYFLFTELLRLVPEKALSFGEVIQLFEARGINTRTCQQRLLAFLEGEIPPGLTPNSQDIQWLNKSSIQNSNYKAIAASPLFDKQGSLSYRPNLRQLQHLRNYLDAIKASAHQSLEEPYTVNFAVGVGE